MYNYYYKCLLTMLLLRNSFIGLIQIKMYFHQMQNFLFKGRIIGNKVDKKHLNWYLFCMECFCLLSLAHH